MRKPRHSEQTVVCSICGEQKTLHEVMPGELIREPVAEAIRKDHPDWEPKGYVCLDDLDRYRMQHVMDVLEAAKGELTDSEVAVMKSLQEQELLTKNVNSEFDQKLTFGQRVADSVAAFGGSWAFIILFGAIIAVWIGANIALLHKPFDPFPFILLNLVLSCLAAIQAPVIMMSQNRQEARDRLRGENDYRVNLKAELEIRGLNARVEELLKHQWQRLMEIQQIQTEMLEEFARHTAAK